MNTITCSGNSISINNGIIKVDGKTIKNGLQGSLTVVVNGDVESLKCDGSVTVNGNVNNFIDCGGSAKVTGDVDAGGSVNCSR